MNSYSGTLGFYVVTYPREQYFNMLYDFLNADWREQASNYHLLWGFTPELVADVTRAIVSREKAIEVTNMIGAKIY